MTAAKHKIQNSNSQEMPYNFLKNGSAKFAWNICRTGINFYPYVFKSGDLTLGLSSRAPGSKIPNACLMIGSISCQSDVGKLFHDFKWWLGNFGVSVLSDSVSRADLCSDIQTDITKHRLDKVTRYITYARDSNIRHSHRKFNSITWGSGQIMCRIYDKTLEMQQTNSAEKELFFADKWGLPRGTPVLRVEFQMRRKAIKEFFQVIDSPDTYGPGPIFYVSGEKMLVDKGLYSLEIFLARAADLWKYLTQDWLRHCDRFVDRENKNQSRAKLSRFWELVQTAPGLIGPHMPIDRKRKPKFIDTVALRKQLTGCMVSTLAGIDGICSKTVDYFDVIATATQILAEDLSAAIYCPASRKNSMQYGTVPLFLSDQFPTIVYTVALCGQWLKVAKKKLASQFEPVQDLEQLI